MLINALDLGAKVRGNAITVKELIAALQLLPPDIGIWMSYGTGQYAVQSIQELKFLLDLGHKEIQSDNTPRELIMNAQTARDGFSTMVNYQPFHEYVAEKAIHDDTNSIGTA